MRNRFFQDVFLASEDTSRKRWLDVIIPCLILGVGIILWIISLQNVDLDRMGDLGLIPVFPAIYYISLLLLSICFVILVYREKLNQALLSSAILWDLTM